MASCRVVHHVHRIKRPVVGGKSIPDSSSLGFHVGAWARKWHSIHALATTCLSMSCRPRYKHHATASRCNPAVSRHQVLTKSTMLSKRTFILSALQLMCFSTSMAASRNNLNTGNGTSSLSENTFTSPVPDVRNIWDFKISDNLTDPRQFYQQPLGSASVRNTAGVTIKSAPHLAPGLKGTIVKAEAKQKKSSRRSRERIADSLFSHPSKMGPIQPFVQATTDSCEPPSQPTAVIIT